MVPAPLYPASGLFLFQPVGLPCPLLAFLREPRVAFSLPPPPSPTPVPLPQVAALRASAARAGDRARMLQASLAATIVAAEQREASAVQAHSVLERLRSDESHAHKLLDEWRTELERVRGRLGTRPAERGRPPPHCTRIPFACMPVSHPAGGRTRSRRLATNAMSYEPDMRRRRRACGRRLTRRRRSRRWSNGRYPARRRPPSTSFGGLWRRGDSRACTACSST